MRRQTGRQRVAGTASRSIRVALTALAVPAGLLAASACADEPTTAAFCGEVVKVPVVRSAEVLQGPSGVAALDALVAALDRLRTHSPKTVRDDVSTLRAVTIDVRRSIASGSDQSDLGAFAAASARLVAFTRQSCGVDLEQRP